MKTVHKILQILVALLNQYDFLVKQSNILLQLLICIHEMSKTFLEIKIEIPPPKKKDMKMIINTLMMLKHLKRKNQNGFDQKVIIGKAEVKIT